MEATVKDTEDTRNTEDTKETAPRDTAVEDTATPEATATAGAPTGSPEGGTGARETAEVSSAKEPYEDGEAGETAAETVVAAAADEVEIPRQQSSEEAVDSKTGEDART